MFPKNISRVGDATRVINEGEAAPVTAKITFQDLNFYYGDMHALKAISLPIYEKCVTAVIGPSGCGKSTLLRVINRIYDIYPRHRASGKVMLGQKNIFDPSLDVNLLRKKVGMVFQKPTPFPMSVFDNVAYGIRLYEKLSSRHLADRVEQALHRAGLWNEVRTDLKKSGLSLSGGQQQRLCIARAIAVGPEVLLMDEPTSALDPASTARIESLITELRSNYTIIIVTHNLQQAARISDYTAFMYLGELIEYGPTRDLFEAPTNPRTRDYVSGRFG